MEDGPDIAAVKDLEAPESMVGVRKIAVETEMGEIYTHLVYANEGGGIATNVSAGLLIILPKANGEPVNYILQTVVRFGNHNEIRPKKG